MLFRKDSVVVGSQLAPFTHFLGLVDQGPRHPQDPNDAQLPDVDPDAVHIRQPALNGQFILFDRTAHSRVILGLFNHQAQLGSLGCIACLVVRLLTLAIVAIIEAHFFNSNMKEYGQLHL